MQAGALRRYHYHGILDFNIMMKFHGPQFFRLLQSFYLMFMIGRNDEGFDLAFKHLSLVVLQSLIGYDINRNHRCFDLEVRTRPMLDWKQMVFKYT